MGYNPPPKNRKPNNLPPPPPPPKASYTKVEDGRKIESSKDKDSNEVSDLFWLWSLFG